MKWGRDHASRQRPNRVVPALRRPMTLIIVALLLVGSSLTFAACSDEGTAGGSTSGQSGTSLQAGKVSQGSGIAPRRYTKPKEINLANVVNLDKASLGEAQKQVLARQGFVATTTPNDAQAWQFWQVYEDARYRGLPVLVTTDSILNTYHTLFDLLLQRLEESKFRSQAIAMSEALYAASSAQWRSAQTDVVKEAARLNIAYFAVGNSLLKGESSASPEVRTEVEAELALIAKAEGIETSPLLGYLEDYSQYKPRGHYTRSETLKRYFRAMMWYGHTAFWVNPKKPDVTLELARRLMRQASLITLALTGDTEQAWKSIYEPTTFMVGTADDLTAAEMRPALGVAFGTQNPSPDQLADDARIDALRRELGKLAPPLILSHVSTGPAVSQEETERSFRVMGQRFIPDSYAFQQLVWRHVGTEDNKRIFPMGLDAMAVLGSDQAYEIAALDYGQTRYQNWEKQLLKVKAEFDTRSPIYWPANLYTGWLDALREVMAPVPAAAPDLMNTRIWARKSLNAALGSWTELRHDTILYAKQSVIAEGDGDEMPSTVGYAEPYPRFYEHMANLARTTQDGLKRFGLRDPVIEQKLDVMIRLCGALKTVADKELAGQALTAEERGVIFSIGSTLEHLTKLQGEDGRTLSPPEEKSPVVADVHSDYFTERVLEEGTGYPLALHAVLEVDGKQQVLVGPAYAYYEFILPLAERMTDEKWRAVLDAGDAPPRPAWTNEFIVE